MKSFYTILQSEARDAGIPMLGIEPFAHIPYNDEVALKRRATERFILEGLRKRSGGEDLIRASKPRHYRTTSRRRLRINRGKASLVHGDGTPAEGESPLEHASHAKIYSSINNLLHTLDKYDREALNHIVVRGTYEEQALILTVDKIDAAIVRMCRSLALRVQKSVPSMQSAWMYVDPKRSRFYLELERPVAGVSSKKLFGAAAWKQQIGNVDYQVGLFSFSQINLAMLPKLVEVVKKQAAVNENNILFDLYCGYGLFGASMASAVKKVYAIDYDENGVNTARYNIGRAGGKVESRAFPINVSGMKKFRSTFKDSSPSVMVVDPPRAGSEKGTIAELAALEPERVVSAFCGPDEISRSISEWKAAGYDATQILPMDLFPGTPGIEIIITFTKR